jgi:hypothetical protein
MSRALEIALAGVLATEGVLAQSPAPEVALVRTPEDGLQPRAVVDDKGELRVVYLAGAPEAADVRYAHSKDGGKTFSDSRAVNQRAASAVAIGNVRGVQLALGRNGRVHVAWNGNGPKDKPGDAPMLYTRLDDSGAAFEAERDVIAKHRGLDGGGAVAADSLGNVHVLWHAPDERGGGEEARRIWVATSRDDGKTFAEELAASPPGAGVCPCCGMGAFALDGSGLAILYRTARESVNRDAVLLASERLGQPFKQRTLDPWKVPT